MSLRIADIPDTPAEFTSWLERQLVGLQLRDLAAELTALSRHLPAPGSRATSLSELFGGRLAEVLTSGLSAITPAQHRALLRHPSLLLELQAQILESGGDYWNRVPLSDEHQAAAARVAQTIAAGPLQFESVAHAGAAAPGRSRRAVLLVLAAAATLLLAAAYWNGLFDGRPQWAFSRPGLLTASLDRDAYLNSLAAAAGDWKRQRRSTGPDLERSIREFKAGCQLVLDAPHPQLPSLDDRDWLIERCKAWMSKLDGHLADLSAKKKPLAQVAADADATIDTLIAKLKERAGGA